MTVVVRLFARARDLAGTDRLAVDLPGSAVVADLRRELAARAPGLAGLLPRCAVAVDAEFAQDDHALADGAEIALLPPVSGG
jgi:molybdopterin converting factor subunit 1